MDIYKYIKEYGYKEINTLNEIDALIFARLAYLHFEAIEDKFPLKISDLNNYLKIMKNNKFDEKLIRLLSLALRFKNVELIRFQSVLDEVQEEQFAALTIKFNEKDLFISYRGTVKSIIAFKEDLNMSYKIVPSQVAALKYLNSEKLLPNLYLGGHSKGGNLAMYAGINASLFRRWKIRKIYNFDGPGFLKINDRFNKMKKKIINFYPEYDIVGQMMYNTFEKRIIKSVKKGIEAHNIYTWKIMSNHFIKGILAMDSERFSYANLKVVETLTYHKKKIIIDYLFDVLQKNHIKRIHELTLDNMKRIINDIPSITKEEKEEFIELFKAFIRIAFPIKKSF